VWQIGVLCEVKCNEIESAGWTKCPYYHYLTNKATSQQEIFLRACDTSWPGKQLAQIWYEETASLSPHAYAAEIKSRLVLLNKASSSIYDSKLATAAAERRLLNK